ncbi:MAG: hypothetical protein KDB23_02165 [Planctomycetales bacterium]|nr:hypothetical protein [Planctomycetales bacterium]
MPKQLALDWNQHQIRLVLVNSQANRLSIEHIESISVPPVAGEPSPATTEAQWQAARELLGATLQDNRYRGAEACVAVRRSDVELRLMSLPPVPDDEMPDIVRMQALREFSEVSEDWPIDYLPLHGSSDETMVLAAVISPRKLAGYRQLLNEHDLKPRSFVLRPTATALLVGQLDDSMRPKVELCVDEMDAECEMSVLRDGTPILIRTVQVPRGEHYDRLTYLNQEIRRTIVASQNQLQGDNVERVVLFGVAEDGTADLSVQLASRLQLPVRVLNPYAVNQLQSKDRVADVPNSRQFAAAIGVLVSSTITQPELIDFGNPRKKAAPRSNRNAITGALAAGLATAAGLIGFYFWHMGQLDHQARVLQGKVVQQKKLVEAAEARVLEVQSIEQWIASDVNWLAELHDISQNLPTAEKVRVTRWQATILPNGDGQIVMDGIADQQGTIGQINQGLRGEQRRVEGSGGDFDEKERIYPWGFKETITIANNVQPVKAPSTRRRPSRRNNAE